jgi:hypothetical protein
MTPSRAHRGLELALSYLSERNEYLELAHSSGWPLNDDPWILRWLIRELGMWKYEYEKSEKNNESAS